MLVLMGFSLQRGWEAYESPFFRHHRYDRRVGSMDDSGGGGLVIWELRLDWTWVMWRLER